MIGSIGSFSLRDTFLVGQSLLGPETVVAGLVRVVIVPSKYRKEDLCSEGEILKLSTLVYRDVEKPCKVATTIPFSRHPRSSSTWCYR